jgi:SHS2 domain-containing protein
MRKPSSPQFSESLDTGSSRFMTTIDSLAHWEHFDHDADVGIRGIGPDLAKSFEQAAMAMTALVTDPKLVGESKSVSIHCKAKDDEILFLDWINELIYLMSAQKILFGRFEVSIQNSQLIAKAFGESIDKRKHQPAVEIKGATFTELRVYQSADSMWIAQCVVDV